METITKGKVENLQQQKAVHRQGEGGLTARIHFGTSHSHVLPYLKAKRWLNLPFENSIQALLPTGVKLFKRTNGTPGVCREIEGEEELKIIQDWIEQNKDLVFLRDLLPISLALNLNFEPEIKNYTAEGRLEHQAKASGDQMAINSLIKKLCDTIHRFPILNSVDFVCAVPAQPEKSFDLPRSLAEGLAQKLWKPNLTGNWAFQGQKESVKCSDVLEKWATWEACRLTYSGPSLKGRRVLLLDDKYQSGITLQYVAMKLQEAGANEVYGLCCVKTLRDDDNS